MKVADPPGGDIKDIAFAPSKPSVVYLASDTNAMGVWRSDDAGETWRQVSALYGLPIIPGHPLGGAAAHIRSISVDPNNSDVVLVADTHNLIKMAMTQGGVQLKSVYPPELPEEGPKRHGIAAVVFSPSMPNVTYAADDDGNILKSTDGGDTWQGVSRIESRPSSVAVNSRGPDTLYAGTGTGVFKSTNGGRDWQQVLTGANVYGLTITTGAPAGVFAATSDGVYKTSDGGATWRRTLDHKAHSVKVAPSDSSVVFAGTPSGVFKSTDSGETWQLHTSGMEYINVGPIAVHPRDPNTVIAGSNINLWTSYGGPFPASTAGEGIYKTADGGLSWVRKGRGEFIDRDVIEVAVAPDNPNVVYAGTRASRGIYRSEDGGMSWTILPLTQPAHYTMRIVTAGDSLIWLTGGGGIAQSTDGGWTWGTPFSRLEGVKTPLHLFNDRHFHGIGISPHDPRLMLVGTVAQDPQGGTYYPGARILRSTDGGLSWQEVGTGFPSGANTAIEDFAFDPFDRGTVYVATSSHHDLSWFMHEGLHAKLKDFVALGIYRSTDAGQTWAPANNGLSDENVPSIVASPAQKGLLFAGTATGVFRSTDGGNTWAPLDLREHVNRLLIDHSEPNSLYAGTDRGLFWSSDEGGSWQRLESLPAKPVTGLTMDAQGRVLYAAVNTVGVFKGVKP